MVASRAFYPFRTDCFLTMQLENSRKGAGGPERVMATGTGELNTVQLFHCGRQHHISVTDLLWRHDGGVIGIGSFAVCGDGALQGSGVRQQLGRGGG